VPGLTACEERRFRKAFYAGEQMAMEEGYALDLRQFQSSRHGSFERLAWSIWSLPRAWYGRDDWGKGGGAGMEHQVFTTLKSTR
jgi:hypothetical protein